MGGGAAPTPTAAATETLFSSSAIRTALFARDVLDARERDGALCAQRIADDIADDVFARPHVQSVVRALVRRCIDPSADRLSATPADDELVDAVEASLSGIERHALCLRGFKVVRNWRRIHRLRQDGFVYEDTLPCFVSLR